MEEIAMSEPIDPSQDPEDHRRLGAVLFNRTWTLLETADRTTEQDEEMVHTAHASAFHWAASGLARPENEAISQWQLSRVYAVVGRGEPALHHARRCLEVCQANGIEGFHLASAHEALARAHWVGGDEAEARRHAALARQAGERIEDAEDREAFDGDMATLPVR